MAAAGEISTAHLTKGDVVMMKDNAREDGNVADNDQSSERQERLEAGMTRAGAGEARGRCYILELPKELRLQIYELLSPDCIQLRTYDKPTVVGLTGHEIATKRIYRMRDEVGVRQAADKHYHISIAYTCHQVYDEARTILKRPQHIIVRPSLGSTPSDGREFAPLYSGVPIICLLQSLTVCLITMDETAAEDLAQSQAIISILRPGLKVQDLVLQIVDYCGSGDAGFAASIFTSLTAMLTVWLEAGLGVNISVVIEERWDTVRSWNKTSGGQWQERRPGNDVYDLDEQSFYDRLFKTLKIISPPASLA
ncbi:hypothetical protein LTR15_000558 [Elasticomyces elasticus]|nr:hypothetical protein LTR15_000558 [Elasticomyces elasticus]